MNQHEALLVALNALQAIDDEHPYPIAKHAIVQISRVLAQPEQWDTSDMAYRPNSLPPSHPWVSLTDAEIAETVGSPLDEVYLVDFRKVMEKLKEKNNG
jgi:hypothetical protein